MMPDIDTTDSLLPPVFERSDFTFVDVNPRIGENIHGELIYDEIAIIQGSIINLLSCPVGSRGRTFRPTYGSAHYNTLQEPIGPATASVLKAQIVQTLNRWEPRIILMQEKSSVVPDYTLPGYIVTIAFVMKISRRTGAVVIDLPTNG